MGATEGRRPRLEILEPEFDRVFPVFYSYYNDNPLGTVTIRNAESGSIEDVRVTFFVNSYMDSPQTIAVIDEMARDAETRLNIEALFRETILGVTEPTSVQARISVEYSHRGESMRVAETFAMRVQNRNQMTWDDDLKAASFVTAGDPAVRDEESNSANERIRLAMAIYEAIRIYGIDYVIDPDSSYIELSQNESALDYVQFPQQTPTFVLEIATICRSCSHHCSSPWGSVPPS